MILPNIFIKNSGRSSHWGTFECKAANPLGQDTAEITLTGELSSELVLLILMIKADDDDSDADEETHF